MSANVGSVIGVVVGIIGMPIMMITGTSISRADVSSRHAAQAVLADGNSEIGATDGFA
jgi:hypothetical protein